MDSSASSSILTKARAARYCRELVDLDPVILAVGIVDKQGDLLAVDWKKNVDWSKELPLFGREHMKNLEDLAGAWVMLFLGVAQQVSTLFGPVERVASVHKNFQVVMIGLPIEGKCIALVLRRSADIGYMISKAKQIVGD